MVEKKTLRDTYLIKRKTLGKAVFDHRVQLISSYFRQLDVTEGSFVHVFLPIQKFMEIDTWSIVDYLESIGAKVVISKSQLDENKMDHFVFRGKEQLEINRWGIPEPKFGERVDPDEIHMVIIPLIVFDRKGHRIGYGKGYYDRFLKECRKDVMKVGLSLAPPLDTIMQAADHDMVMDCCVTHLGIYNFDHGSGNI